MSNRKRVLLGVFLVIGSTLPIAIGMLSAFDQLAEGADAVQVGRQADGHVSLAMSLPFIATANVGILLIIVSLFMKRTG